MTIEEARSTPNPDPTVSVCPDIERPFLVSTGILYIMGGAAVSLIESHDRIRDTVEENENSRIKDDLFFWEIASPSKISHQPIKRCPLGCGLIIPHGDIHIHVESNCPKRDIVCKDCGVIIWGEEYDVHLKSNCIERKITCILGCGLDNLTISNEERHHLHECPNRMCLCECGENVKVIEKHFHDKVECSLRSPFSPQGYSKRIILEKSGIDNNSSSSIAGSTIGRNLYYERATACPLGCGIVMQYKDIIGHVSYICERRLADCPNFCGVPVKVNHLHIHTGFCPNRVLPCDTHSKCCKIPLQDYFYAMESTVDLANKQDNQSLVLSSVSEQEHNNRRTLRVSFAPMEIEEGGSSALVAEAASTGGDVLYLEDSDTVAQYNVKPSSPAPSSLMLTNPAFNYDEVYRNIFKTRASGSRESSTPSYVCTRTKATILLANRVEFKTNLRLNQCSKHGVTALMAAVKSNDFALAVHIVKKVREVKDFDLENCVGDTALTLAARLGKYPFVQLLIENGVDVNYETRSGRTALIEAIKVSDAQIVDILVKFGASVSRRTNKHKMSAIAWARKYDDEDVMRILDLGMQVEERMQLLFADIACGNIDRVRAAVAGGDVFSPGSLPRFHDELLMSVQHLNFTRKLVADWEQKVAQAQSAAATSSSAALESSVQLKAAEDTLSSARACREAANKEIYSHFAQFSEKMRRLTEADIEEVLAVRAPSLSVRVCLLAYGLIFDVLHYHDKDYPYSGDEYTRWFQTVCSSMKLASSTIQRIRIFNMQAFIQSSFMKHIKRFSALYIDLKNALQMERSNDENALMSSKFNSSYSLTTNNHSEESYSYRYKKQLIPLLQKLISLRYRNVVYDSDEDEDNGDSAEGTRGGRWMSGKWVPSARRNMLNRSRKLSSSSSVIDSVQETKQLHDERDGMGVSLSEAQNNESSSGGAFMFYFAEVMHCLLRSLHELSACSAQVLEFDADIERAYARCCDLAELDVNIQSRNKQILAFRAEKEKELIYRLKHLKATNETVDQNLARLKVSRVLNLISPSGYTAVSWAAAYGFYDAVEVLLENGASPGFNDGIFQLAASCIQLTYRIYRIQCGLATSEVVRLHMKSTATAIEKISEIKTCREHVFHQYRLLRRQIKLPITEAGYNGKWEIVELINKKNMFHCHFAHCWHLPVPLPPRAVPRRMEVPRDTPIHFLELLAYGVNEQSCGELMTGLGWVGADHEKAAYGMTIEMLGALWADKMKKRDEFSAQRLRRRLIVTKLRKQEIGNSEMIKAVLNRDVQRCLYLCQTYSCSMDFETDSGFTPLIAAAEENVIGADHVYLKLEDGRDCLAVEFLLDRELYKPAINLETEAGLTALIHACSLNRHLVAQALLDRGANIDQRNKFQKTAAHYAASIGSAQCMRLLIERGADLSIPDGAGQTAVDIANSQGLAQVVQVIAKATGGNFGLVTYQRGTVEMLVSCPYGCGMKVPNEDLSAHFVVCDHRELPCPDCSCNLMAFELKEHLDENCARRLILCEDCALYYHFNETNAHLGRLCAFRLIPCPNGCGEERKTREMPGHLLHCSWRAVPCSLLCSVQGIKMKDLFQHVREDCENRHVLCSLGCGNQFLAKEAAYHMSEICPRRTSACKWCGEVVQQVSKLKHETDCIEREFPCPYKCGELMPKHREAEHWRNNCKHRFVDCPLRCAVKQVREVDLPRHCAEQCENRLVACPLQCIDVTTNNVRRIESKLLDVHTKYECTEREIRCVTCQEYIKAKDHEIHPIKVCNARLVACRLNGCIKTLPISDRDKHERFECRFRMILCPLGCGETLIFNKMGNHQSKCCPRRLVFCPLNCGVEVHSADLENHVHSDCKNKVLSEAALRKLKYGL